MGLRSVLNGILYGAHVDVCGGVFNDADRTEMDIGISIKGCMD